MGFPEILLDASFSIVIKAPKNKLGGSIALLPSLLRPEKSFVKILRNALSTKITQGQPLQTGNFTPPSSIPEQANPGRINKKAFIRNMFCHSLHPEPRSCTQ